MDEEKIKITQTDGKIQKQDPNSAPETSAIEKKIAELSAALEAAKKKKVLPEEVKAPLWKRIINAVIWVVLCLIFAALLLITLTSVMAKARGDRAEIFGFSIYIVRSDSMTPEIKVGDIILSKKVAQDQIKIGDDITFEGLVNGEKAPITHRVIEITETGFVTQGTKDVGEGGTKPTERPDYSEVYGKKIGKSTLAGNIYTFASSQYGFLVVIVVPLFLFVIYESWVLGKKFKALKAADNEDDDGEDKKNHEGEADTGPKESVDSQEVQNKSSTNGGVEENKKSGKPAKRKKS